jgi:hypothetical protein
MRLQTRWRPGYDESSKMHEPTPRPGIERLFGNWRSAVSLMIAKTAYGIVIFGLMILVSRCVALIPRPTRSYGTIATRNSAIQRAREWRINECREVGFPREICTSHVLLLGDVWLVYFPERDASGVSRNHRVIGVNWDGGHICFPGHREAPHQCNSQVIRCNMEERIK